MFIKQRTKQTKLGFMQVKVQGFFLYLTWGATLCLCFMLATPGIADAQDFNAGHIGYTLQKADYNAGLDHDWEGGSHLDSIANDFSYGIVGGYGMVHDNTYFGVEGNFEYTVAEYEWNADDNSENYEKIEINESYGLCARLGYVAKNWLIYGLCGWQKTNFDAELYYGTNLSEYKKNESLNGFRAGIGIEYQTSENIFFRYQYSFTKYEEGNLNENNVNFYVNHARHSQLVYGIRF